MTPEELTAPEGHLALGSLTVKRDGKDALTLASDGTVMDLAQGKELGRMKRDGSFLDPAGKLVAKLTAEGEVTLANGDFLPVTVTSNGDVKLLKESRQIRIRPDGSLDGANPDGPSVSFAEVPPKLARAAAFLLVLVAYPARTAP